MNIQHFFRVLLDRFWIISFIVLMTVLVTFFLTKAKPNVYSASSTIILDVAELAENNITMPVALRDQYLNTQLGVVLSLNVVRDAVDILGYADKQDVVERYAGLGIDPKNIRDSLVKDILSALTVSSDGDSWLVKVSYEAEDPQWAAEVVNSVVDAYMSTLLELNVEPARERARWIDEQLAEFGSKLEQAQNRLTAYKNEKGILGSNDKLDIELERLRAITSQVTTAQIELENSIYRLDQLQNNQPDTEALDVMPEILSNPYLQRLKTDLRDKETEIADLSSQVGRRHPEYLRINAEISSLRSELREEIQKAIKGIEHQVTTEKSRLDALLEMQEKQKNELLRIGQAGGDLSVLQREVESAQRNYEDALSSSQHFKMKSRVSQTNVKVLDRAKIPTIPVSPNMKLNLALAIVLGLIAGIVFALILELRNRKVRSKQDLSDIGGVPFLGSLRKG